MEQLGNPVIVISIIDNTVNASIVEFVFNSFSNDSCMRAFSKYRTFNIKKHLIHLWTIGLCIFFLLSEICSIHVPDFLVLMINTKLR